MNEDDGNRANINMLVNLGTKKKEMTGIGRIIYY